MASSSDTPAADGAQLERRGFFAQLWATAIGGLIVLIPTGTALAVLLDPWRRKAEDGQFIPVAPLDAVPDDGSVRQFPVVAQRVDAWNRSQQPVGAVYLRRVEGQEAPECLTATCPHAGCFVAFDAHSDVFKCPCHNSSFALDGAIIPPSPSPRPMDKLECKVEQGEILVKFENFYCGKAEKIVKR